MSPAETLSTLISIGFLCYACFIAGETRTETKQLKKESLRFRQEHEAWCKKMDLPAPEWT